MLIVANWKAYVEDLKRAKELAALARRLAGRSRVSLVLAPSAPYLSLLAAPRSRARSKVAFAAQDISATTGGAHTGETTAAAAAAAGASYTIIGHSERRAAGETDEIIAHKLAHALAHGLTPILCVGEHSRDGEGQYLSFLRAELTRALEPLSAKERASIVIAYEPLWAIGKTSAEAIRPTDLVEMASYIRKVLAELLSGRSATSVRVLYGGSVNPENARGLLADSGIDGLLVGRASVDPATFSGLVKSLS